MANCEQESKPSCHVDARPAKIRSKGRSLRLVGACLVVMLLGCDDKVVYQDISSSVPEIIGARYRVKGRVLVYGIRKHSKAPIDYIQLMPPPGIGGSQIVPLPEIPIGVIFKIVSAWKSNHIEPNSNSVLVEFENFELPEKVPTRIEYFRGNNQHWWGFALNSEYYERIPNFVSK
jgi:hypothetical protein